MHIYNDSFNPMFPTQNMIAFNDDGGGNSQFMLVIMLEPLAKYILVVTTFGMNQTGAFSSIAVGIVSVSFHT